MIRLLFIVCTLLLTIGGVIGFLVTSGWAAAGWLCFAIVCGFLFLLGLLPDAMS
ncbi:MAG: hypothetical protein M5U25_17495 [Planctomycetota bacterium]|nr:hypothetical protein [Planctomycetota bacterium]